MQLYYVISYKHSSGGYVTFWGPNNAGYTTNIANAGKYTEEEIEKHFSYYNGGYLKGGVFIAENMAVKCEEFEKLHTVISHVEMNQAARAEFSKKTKAEYEKRKIELVDVSPKKQRAKKVDQPLGF